MMTLSKELIDQLPVVLFALLSTAQPLLGIPLVNGYALYLA